jgi:hypothetical protein
VRDEAGLRRLGTPRRGTREDAAPAPLSGQRLKSRLEGLAAAKSACAG